MGAVLVDAPGILREELAGAPELAQGDRGGQGERHALVEQEADDVPPSHVGAGLYRHLVGRRDGEGQLGMTRHQPSELFQVVVRDAHRPPRQRIQAHDLGHPARPSAGVVGEPRRAAVARDRVVVAQQLRHLGVAVLQRQVERRLAAGVPGVDVAALAHDDTHQIGVAAGGGGVEHARAVLLRRVGVAGIGEQVVGGQLRGRSAPPRTRRCRRSDGRR
jgi:hypothetical protein